MADPIEMPFVGHTLVSPRYHIFDEDPDPPCEGAFLRGTCAGS